MFIGRTQGEQEWQKPKYRLKKGQQKAWKHLLRVAKDEYSRAQGIVDQKSGDDSNKRPEQEQSPSIYNDDDDDDDILSGYEVS